MESEVKGGLRPHPIISAANAALKEIERQFAYGNVREFCAKRFAHCRVFVFLEFTVCKVLYYRFIDRALLRCYNEKEITGKGVPGKEEMMFTIRFCLAAIEYERTNKSFIENERLELMRSYGNGKQSW